MLSQNELDTYQEVKKIFTEAFKIPCTGCRYCVPCPFGVDIPNCFAAYNTSCSISKSQANIQYMWLLMGEPGYASLCKKCGKCEPLCPQKIPIMNSLKEVEKNMEGIMFKVSKFGVNIFMGKKKSKKK